MLAPSKRRGPQAAILEARPLAPGRHIGLLPQLVADLWLHGSPRSKDFNTCISLNQEDLEISTQLMPRRVRRSRRNPWEANPQAFIPRCKIQSAPTASFIEHRLPATAIDTHSRSYPGQPSQFWVQPDGWGDCHPHLLAQISATK